MAEQHSLDPVRAALREFEEAVKKSTSGFVRNKPMDRQEVNRARDRVMESIMELVRKTLKERGVA